MRPLLAAAVLAVLAAGAARADEAETLSVTVQVEPPVGLASTVATVSGKTDPVGDNPSVQIEFTVDSRAEHNDKARPVKATAKVDSKGDYSAKVQIDQPGVYLVKVTAPDGKGTQSSTFTLLDPPDLRDDLEESFTTLSTVGLKKRIESLKEQIAGIPANPARLDAEERLAKLSSKLEEWPEQGKKLKEATDKLQEVVKKYPAAGPALQPRLQALAEQVGKNKAEEALIEQQLEASRAADATCEKLDAVIEGLKQVSAALNFIQSGLADVAKAFNLDGATDRFTAFITPKSLEGNAAVTFAIKETSKFAAAAMLGPVGWADAIVGLVVDVSGFVQEQNFAKYCEKLEGPMSATMHAAFTQGTSTWWTYDMTLQGKLILRYAKGAGKGAAVHVNGEFVGSATKLEVWENALAVLYPVTEKTSTLLRKLVVPPGLPFYDTEGKTVGAASPNAFNVQVEGDLVGDKLTLTLGSARSDISDAVEAKVTYVLIGPMILAPIIVKYSLPFTKAQKLLFRSMTDGPIEIPVVVTTKSMTLQKALTRKRPGENNVVDYTLNLKACNPGCK